MMITVHGLPFKTKFQDVKALIKQECNIPDFILDNLDEDGYDSKKVRIGLTTEGDGLRLINCLDGFRMSGSHVLRVVPVGKTSFQPQSSFESRSSYSNQSKNDYPNQSHSYGNQTDYRPNPSSHNSPHGTQMRNTESRQPNRNINDTRPPQRNPQDSRDQFRGHGDRRDPLDARPDFHDPKKGPLLPPSLRPASMSAGLHGIDSRRPDTRSLDRANVRGQEGPMRGQEGPMRGQVGPMRGSEATSSRRHNSPVRSQESSMRGPEATVRRQEGPMRSHDAPMRSHEAPMRSHEAPMRSHEAPLRSHDAPLRNPDSIRSHDSSRALDSGMHSDRPVVRTDSLMRGDGPRGLEFPGYPKPEVRQPVPNMDINRQPQWPVNNDPWTNSTGSIQNPTSGFNYQQDGVGYGQQPHSAPQGPLGQRAPQQNYPPAKPTLASDRVVSSVRPHVLRSVELVDAPIQARVATNYPQMQKPVTIMKDNFQGPTQYNVSGAPPPYGGTQWNPQSPNQPKPYDKYDDKTQRRFSPPRGRAASPGRGSPPRTIQSNRAPPYPDRRVSPRPFTLFSPRNVSPKPRLSPGRRTSPNRRLVSPTRRSPKPSDQRRSPIGRKISPSARRISPYRKASPNGQRRISPFARKISPSNQRRVSPFARKVSPNGGPRRISPFGRKVSPTGRRVSPKRDDLRRNSPSTMRYDYYVEDERRMGGRLESPRQYSPKRSPQRGSGRYSPSAAIYDHDNKVDKQNRAAFDSKQAQKYTGAGFRPNVTQFPSQMQARAEPKIPSWQTDKIAYPLKEESRPNPLEETRKKLSPRRSRSRSPVKDRYRRHSPSPRSPRRSWALEKRRSPEPLPPPPPLWPGQPENKPKPVWERNPIPERFDNKRTNEDKFQRTTRFSPRRDVDDYQNKFNDYEEKTFTKPPRDENKLFNEADKDFNDIYQRAVEFRRKTEELRQSNDRRSRFEDQKREHSPPHAAPNVNWVPADTKDYDKDRRIFLEPEVKQKRDKACLEIAQRILKPHNFSGEPKERVLEELKFSVFKLMLEMFKDKDVSYIELVIKFRARYDAADEEKILRDVLESMPNHYKNSLKRKGDDISEVPAKISRTSPTYMEEKTRAQLSDSVIPDLSLPPPQLVDLQGPAQMGAFPPPMFNAPVLNNSMMNQQPMFVPIPDMFPSNGPMSTAMASAMQAQLQSGYDVNMQDIQSRMQEYQSGSYNPKQPEPENDFILYLCQDDFDSFSEYQSENLRNFLVAQVFNAAQANNGWSPEISFRGLNSSIRYEVATKDHESKRWLQNLDFRAFGLFNILVYTQEELWYERAAIWLPGHSRYRNIDAFEKLRLQNQQVTEINLGKWKYVKKIVTHNGTRLYVDMPPSDARALEDKKMMLSYELDKHVTGSGRLNINPRKRVAEGIDKRSLRASRPPVKSRRHPFSSAEHTEDDNQRKYIKQTKVIPKDVTRRVNAPKAASVKSLDNSKTEHKTAPIKRKSLENIQKPTEDLDASMEDANVVPKSQRFNELSPLMNKMVEEQLKNIMIMIWQTLPDDAPDEAEKYVLDKLKNDAGDDLRNALGLNITERLLNVDNNPSKNGVMIKIQMDAAVSERDKYEFAKQYGVTELKTVMRRTCAGRLRSWAALDKLYEVKHLRCGKSPVTITPVYNFLKCPPMLKTVFDGKQDYSTKEIEKKAAKMMKPKGKTIITADKVLAEDSKRVDTAKDIIGSISRAKVISAKPIFYHKSNTVIQNTVENKTVPKCSVSKSEENVISTKTQPKPTTNTVIKKTVENKTVSKDSVSKAEEKVISTKPLPKPNTIINKTISNPDVKSTGPAKTLNKPSVPTVKKETETNKVVATTPKANKELKQPIVQPDKTPKTVTNQQKTQISSQKNIDIKGEKPTVKDPAKTTANEPTKIVPKDQVKPASKEIIKPTNNPPKMTAKTVATSKPVTPKAPPKPAKITAKDVLSASKPATTVKENAKPKVTAESVLKTQSKVTAKIVDKGKNNDKDFEELSDKDILALLSGGIVLDECSGSDEE